MTDDRHLMLKIEISSDSVFAFNRAMERTLASLIAKPRRPILLELDGCGKTRELHLYQAMTVEGMIYVIVIISDPP